MAKVAIVMGSTSDWPTMQNAAKMLKLLGVEFEAKVVSAHRTPDLLTEFATSAAQHDIAVIIAGAGGAAHLPGMIAAHTHIPVLGCPVRSSQLSGMDSIHKSSGRPGLRLKVASVLANPINRSASTSPMASSSSIKKGNGPKRPCTDV